MGFRSLGILFMVVFLAGCSDEPPKEHLHPKYSGVYMDHGPQQGQYYTDPQGNSWFYRYMTTTISNDSVMPLHIDLAFLKEYHYPAPMDEQTFKVFLLPETLMADKEYEAYQKDLKNFLDRPLEKPLELHKIIYPKGSYEITIGVLTGLKYMSPGQFALLSKGHKLHFLAHDSLISQAVANSKPLELSLALDFYSADKSGSCFSFIPCGRMVYGK